MHDDLLGQLDILSLKMMFVLCFWIPSICLFDDARGYCITL